MQSPKSGNGTVNNKLSIYCYIAANAITKLL